MSSGRKLIGCLELLRVEPRVGKGGRAGAQGGYPFVMGLSEEVSRECDVLVLGAGMAGLTAARALAERGLRVTVLEARERVGGRVMTRHENGQAIELGAEFVHGRAPELWALIEEAGLEAVEREGTMLRSREGVGVAEDDPEDDAVFAPLEALEGREGPDMPFAEWLAQSDVPEEERAGLTAYVEGFNAADARVIGIHGLGAQQKAEEEIDGDLTWHVRGGYAQVAEYLARRIGELGGKIVPGAEVKEVDWQPQSVRVVTTDGAHYQAEKCVIALPLPVVQRMNDGGIMVQPQPQAILEARRIAMGHVARFSLVFRRAWWVDAPNACDTETMRRMSFLFTQETLPSVWWTPHPEDSAPMLTAWVGGPRSARLNGLSAEELGRAACGTLAQVFGLPEGDLLAELQATHVHDWSGDPYALGAYSYIPAGALDAPRKMGEPERGTLFFAGEYTDVTAHWGTVHAAMRSGLRAAAQVLGESAG